MYTLKGACFLGMSREWWRVSSAKENERGERLE